MKEKEISDQEQELKNQLAVLQQQKKDIRAKKAELKVQLDGTQSLLQS